VERKIREDSIKGGKKDRREGQKKKEPQRRYPG
jgi:hypothetical protein